MKVFEAQTRRDMENKIARARELEAEFSKLRTEVYEIENKFIVSFDESLYDLYMDAIKKLDIEDKFEIETIDVWKGRRIPRVYSLFIKDSEDIRVKFDLYNEVYDVTRGRYSLFARRCLGDKSDLCLPLMAITKEEELVYTWNVKRINHKMSDYGNYAERSGDERIFSRVNMTSKCDKEKKKYLYWNFLESSRARSTDLPNYMLELMKNERYMYIKNML